MNDTVLLKAAALTVVPRERHHELIERWWNDHFPGSPVAQSTAAWNHAFAAKEELKRRLAGPEGIGLKEEH